MRQRLDNVIFPFNIALVFASFCFEGSPAMTAGPGMPLWESARQGQEMGYNGHVKRDNQYPNAAG